MLFIVIIIETQIICKMFIYTPLEDTFDQVNSILYNFLISSGEPLSTYKIKDTFYVCSSSKASLIILRASIAESATDDVYLITNDIKSSKISSFLNNGYKYIIDADGLWIDSKYRQPPVNSFIVCVHWVETPLAVSENATKVLASMCFDNTENGFTLVIKDITNEMYILYLYPYLEGKIITTKVRCNYPLYTKNLNDVLIFTTDLECVDLMQ